MERRYVITKPAFKAHYLVTSPPDTHLVAVGAKLRPRRPRLALHAGPSAASPVLAVLHLPPASAGMKVGLGDPAASAVEWEDLTCLARTTHAKYAWSATLPGDGGGGGPGGGPGAPPRRRTFTWTRTRHHGGVDGARAPAPATSGRRWELAEEGREERVLALFTGEPGVGRCGTLAVCGDMGAKFRVMALITLLGLYDRARSAGGG